MVIIAIIKNIFIFSIALNKSTSFSLWLEKSFWLEDNSGDLWELECCFFDRFAEDEHTC